MPHVSSALSPPFPSLPLPSLSLFSYTLLPPPLSLGNLCSTQFYYSSAIQQTVKRSTYNINPPEWSALHKSVDTTNKKIPPWDTYQDESTIESYDKLLVVNGIQIKKSEYIESQNLYSREAYNLKVKINVTTIDGTVLMGLVCLGPGRSIL